MSYPTAYEYVPDSEITGVTLQSGASEEDLVDKVIIIIICVYG